MTMTEWRCITTLSACTALIRALAFGKLQRVPSLARATRGDTTKSLDCNYRLAYARQQRTDNEQSRRRRVQDQYSHGRRFMARSNKCLQLAHR